MLVFKQSSTFFKAGCSLKKCHHKQCLLLQLFCSVQKIHFCSPKQTLLLKNNFSAQISNPKNRLLKFCYVPATSAAHNRLLFFFLLQLFTVLMKKTRAVKQSIYSQMSMLQCHYQQRLFFSGALCDHWLLKKCAVSLTY